MTKLVIHSLVCNETSDGMGADDIFINFQGIRVWGTTLVDAGQTHQMEAELDFNVRGRVDVWEFDSGSDNDHIGTFWVNRSQAGTGERSVSLTGDDSDYIITYEVLS
ncbi:hypothetical protein [Dactylosporangium sp. NPDC006015]|uniref:hypothetical protein n=1 Tax=Dactylosporangium sp. NPDC006015 TaxID=3154576 RepID=UPI00339DBFE7